MSKKIYFSKSPRLPFFETILIAFLMYYFHANGIVIGVVSTLGVILWITCITALNKSKVISIEDFIDTIDKINKEENGINNVQLKSKFQKRLDDLAKERNK